MAALGSQPFVPSAVTTCTQSLPSLSFVSLPIVTETPAPTFPPSRLCVLEDEGIGQAFLRQLPLLLPFAFFFSSCAFDAFFFLASKSRLLSIHTFDLLQLVAHTPV